MYIYLIAFIYILINVYVILRIRKWLKCCHSFFHNRWFQVLYITVYALLASSLLTSFLLPSSSFQIFVKKLSNYWLGTFVYILLSFLVVEMVVIVLKLTRKMPRRGSSVYKRLTAVTGMLVTLTVVAFSIYGAVHAKQLQKKEYNVTISKSAGDLTKLRVVLISDLHLGYSVGVKDVEKMVSVINQAEPDLVCIAGDIYDNDFDAVDDPEGISRLLTQIESTYGIYACYGNHDVSERLLGGFSVASADELRDRRVDKMLADGGVTVLNDEVRLIDNSFYLIGRLDAHKTGVEGLKQKTIEEFTRALDKEKPLLVMEHQPKELSEEAACGIDLEMAGHTHEGQIFPGNLTINLMWDNAYGYYSKGDFQSIVTSGTGVWGPNMRVGTDAEVAIINIAFVGA